MAELDDNIHKRIQALCEEGDAFAEEEDFAEARTMFQTAWELLPEPRTEWAAASWILGALGDVNFLNDDFDAARDHLTQAMECPDAIGNPFLHLRLGQCQFELGNLDRAADGLGGAFMSEGGEIFADEDPKYFEFLKTRLKPPH